MHILLISPGFAADANDQSCIPPLQLLAQMLVKKGISLDILALEYPFSKNPYDFHGARVWPQNGRNRRLLRWFTAQKALQKAIQLHGENPFHAVHSFWIGQAMEIGHKVAKKLDIPHFTTAMGQDVQPGNRYLRSTACDKVAVLSRFHEQAYRNATGKVPFCSIPWAADPVPSPPPDFDARSIDLLGVGSLLPVKNWALWLKIVQKTVACRPDLRAVLIGDGPENPALMAEAQALGLSSNLRFAGQMPRPDDQNPQLGKEYCRCRVEPVCKLYALQG